VLVIAAVLGGAAILFLPRAAVRAGAAMGASIPARRASLHRLGPAGEIVRRVPDRGDRTADDRKRGLGARDRVRCLLGFVLVGFLAIAPATIAATGGEDQI